MQYLLHQFYWSQASDEGILIAPLDTESLWDWQQGAVWKQTQHASSTVQWRAETSWDEAEGDKMVGVGTDATDYK